MRTINNFEQFSLNEAKKKKKKKKRNSSKSSYPKQMNNLYPNPYLNYGYYLTPYNRFFNCDDHHDGIVNNININTGDSSVIDAGAGDVSGGGI